jgi:hemolysin activation/secretion protein
MPIFNQVIKKLALSLIVLSGINTYLYAQNTPDPTPELRRQAEQQETLKAQQLKKSDVKQPQPSVQKVGLLPSNENPCFQINNVKLLNLTGQETEFNWLYEALSGSEKNDHPIGKCIGIKGVETLIKRLQNDAIGKGWVTTRVLAQQQNLKAGELAFTVIPGRIRTIKFKDGKDQPVSFVNAFPVKSGDLLNLRDIEQALENFKRVPTVEADIKIEPGELPGESDVSVVWSQSKSLRYSLSLDDSGSDSTGKYQGTATVSIDNPLGLSDLFYISASNGFGGEGPDPKGSQNVSAHFSLPYGNWLLSTNVSASQYNQTVIGAYQDYAYSGNSSNFDIKLSKMLWRDAKNKTTAHIKLQNRASKNFIEDTEVEVQRRAVTSIEAAVSHRYFWNDSTLEGQLSYRQGIKAFGTLEAPEEEFGEGTSLYQLLSLDLSLKQPLKIGNKELSWQNSLRYQHALTPLTPQDRFSIGGRGTVRGFDVFGLSAEDGLLLKSDLSLKLPWPQQEIYAGLDLGMVSGASTQYLVGKYLGGVTIGFKGQAKGASYEFFISKGVLKPSEVESLKPVYGFTLNYSF